MWLQSVRNVSKLLSRSSSKVQGPMPRTAWRSLATQPRSKRTNKEAPSRTASTTTASNEDDIVAFQGGLQDVASPPPCRPLDDVERMHCRAGWAPQCDEAEDDILVIQEGIGVDPLLNWTIVSHNLVAKNRAYRNLHMRGLLKLAPRDRVQLVNPSKAVVVDLPAEQVSYPGTVRVGNGANQIKPEAYRDLQREIRRQLSSIDDLFVHDGIIGGGADAGKLGARVRTFSDQSISASQVAALLHPLETLVSPEDFNPELNVFILSDISALPASLGLNQEKAHVYLCPEQSEVYVLNSLSSTVLQRAIVEARAACAAAVEATAEDKTPSPVLVNASLTKDNYLLLNPPHSTGVLISGDQCAPLFGGAPVAIDDPKDSNRGEVIEKTGASSIVVRSQNVEATFSKPAGALIIDSRAKTPKKLQTEKELKEFRVDASWASFAGNQKLDTIVLSAEEFQKRYQ